MVDGFVDGCMRHADDSLTVEQTQRQWLRRVMREKGISATEMAEQAGLAASTIHRAMRDEGPQLLGVPTLRKISAALDVAVTVDLVPTVLPEIPPIDPLLLRMALEDTRHALRGVGNSKYPELEAELAAQILDSLLAAAREGRSVEEARKTLQGWLRHYRRS